MRLFKRFSHRQTPASNSRPPAYDTGHGRQPSFPNQTDSKLPPPEYQRAEPAAYSPASIPPSKTTQWEDIAKTASALEVGENDVVIAIMGVTGTGKSTFIDLVTGLGVEIGHGLESCTTHVGAHAFKAADGRRIFLIDTPGFDDTHRSDSDVLREIAYFLSASYSRKVNLAGIVYLHPITEARLKGSALKNLAMFQALCGTADLSHVVLATTKWDELANTINAHLGPSREQELQGKPEFWGAMIENGSRVFRHLNTQASALEIINYVLAQRGHMVLDIQRQMVDEDRDLDQTSAGKELRRELEEERVKHEKDLQDIRAGHEAAIKAGNQKMADTMAQMARETDRKLKKFDDENRKLRISNQKLKAEEEAKYQSRINELMNSLNQYQAEADAKQSALSDLQAETSKLREDLNKVRSERVSMANKWNESVANRNRQIALEEHQRATAEAERQARNAAYAAQQKRSNIVSMLQGAAGLGMMVTGALSGMQPSLIGVGAAMVGQAANNALSGPVPPD